MEPCINQRSTHHTKVYADYTKRAAVLITVYAPPKTFFLFTASTSQKRLDMKILHPIRKNCSPPIAMYPKTVHFVREYQYCSFPEWDEEIQKNIRWQIGREWIILKANGRTRKFKKYLDDDRTEADIDKTVTKEFEYLRVDWRQNGTNVWFHVTAPDEYY